MKKCITMFIMILMIVLNGPLPAYATWQYSTSITGTSGSNFGNAIDMVRTSDGDFLAVGDSTNTYIYKRNETTGNWDLKDTINVGGEYSIALTDDRIAINSLSNIYSRDNAEGTSWTQETSPSGYPENDSASVDLHGDVVVYGYGEGTSNYAAILRYYDHPDEGLGWWNPDLNERMPSFPMALGRMMACDGPPGDQCDEDHFGISVGINTDITGDNVEVLVGAPGHDLYFDGSAYSNCTGNGGTDCGAAYIYRSSNGGVDWENRGSHPSIELYPSDVGTALASNNQFGTNGFVGDNYLAVTSKFGGGVSNSDGTVSVFEKNVANWDFLEEFQHSDASGNDDEFGASIDMEGDYMVIGVPGYNNQEGGKIYAFELSAGSWDNEIFDYQDTGSSLGTEVAVVGNDYYMGGGNPQATDPDVQIFSDSNGGDPNGAIPEFSDYMYILTIIIAISLMVKIIPKTNFYLQPK